MIIIIRKNLIFIGIMISMIFFFISTLNYPGGSQEDVNSIGFSWRHNYISNLLSPKAINGAENSARFWAICGIFFLCFSFALSFVNFSKKIGQRGPAFIIRFFGIGAMFLAFLVVTPLHDLMVTISATLTLVCFFYVAFFVFKSKLNLLKVIAALSLVLSYGCCFIYFTRSYLEFLPLMQKISLVLIIIWILGLEFFTSKEDFNVVKRTL